MKSRTALLSLCVMTLAGSLAPGVVPAAAAPTPAAASAAVTFQCPRLGIGSAGANVIAAKYLLRARGYAVGTDATYRAATAAEVRRFQAARRLTADGVVGTTTWPALFVTLRPGARGDAVRAVQVELSKAGYPVAVTGVFEAATLSAVRRLQAARALVVDGIVGPLTWSSLVRGSRPATVVWKGTTTRKVVALTFDAGSDLGRTSTILNVLAANHIPATFGLTGTWVLAHPAVARAIVAAGHEVVNHTYDHASFTGYSTGRTPLTFAQRQSEIDRAWAAIDTTTHARFSGWFRPPYGDRNAGVDRDAGVLGYPRELMWTVDSLGWKGVPAGQVVSRVLAAASPGEIVLMHVGAASTDAAALPAVISGLRAKGYSFVTADGVMH